MIMGFIPTSLLRRLLVPSLATLLGGIWLMATAIDPAAGGTAPSVAPDSTAGPRVPCIDVDPKLVEPIGGRVMARAATVRSAAELRKALLDDRSATLAGLFGPKATAALDRLPSEHLTVFDGQLTSMLEESQDDRDWQVTAQHELSSLMMMMAVLGFSLSETFGDTAYGGSLPPNHPCKVLQDQVDSLFTAAILSWQVWALCQTGSVPHVGGLSGAETVGEGSGTTTTTAPPEPDCQDEWDAWGAVGAQWRAAIGRLAECLETNGG